MEERALKSCQTLLYHENTQTNNSTREILPLPWENLNYDDIKGEVWKPLPSFDNLFFISNFGRVKSIDRAIECTNNNSRFYKGRIYKAAIKKFKNNTVGDFTIEVKIGLSYMNKNVSLRLARTVYSTFVQPLEYRNTDLIVKHKDGNRLNNQVSNLELQTISQKQKQIFTSNRVQKLSTFHTKEGYKKAAVARYKPVTQFCELGNPIKSFKSIQEASLITGISAPNISSALTQKRMVVAGGYLWQYGIINTPIDITYCKTFIEILNKK